MVVLVVNCGSSTLKADVLHADTGVRRAMARVERIGSGATLRLGDAEPVPIDAATHGDALRAALPLLLAHAGVPPVAVGHRVVHGGDAFTEAVAIDDAVEAGIAACIDLAPLHNPANLAGIRAARELLPDLPHVAVFDTAFHASLPRRARAYAIDADVADAHGFRRYGFHGTSHAWVAQRAAEWLGEDARHLRIITCHLGNGSSVCAVEYGRSIETSMGMTPLEGLVMGTRAGDIDAGLVLEWMRRDGLGPDEMDTLLNRKSGLAGLSGVGNDMRDIQERAAAGDERCRLAIQVYAHRLRKYVGAYAAVMGGVDAIVFTAGIGEHSAVVRHRAAQRLEFLGARLDEDKNRAARVSHADPVFEISHDHSRVRLLVVQTDEEWAIAEYTARVSTDLDRREGLPAIPIAVSARHVHLTDAAVEVLFGAGHRLRSRKPLSQPGQFVCTERVSVVGPRRRFDDVAIIGPTRPRCQVEVSRTDEFALGIDAPVRDSGDVDHTPGVTLVGPAGTLQLDEGVICARRHIHMHPDDAALYGVADRDVVEVRVDSEGRDLVFGDVLVRVKDSYRLEMHLDTDEANAAEIEPGETGVLAATSRQARLTRRVR